MGPNLTAGFVPWHSEWPAGESFTQKCSARQDAKCCSAVQILRANSTGEILEELCQHHSERSAMPGMLLI